MQSTDKRPSGLPFLRLLKYCIIRKLELDNPTYTPSLQAGSGLLSGDMSAALPESVERAEEVLRHTREVLARADGNAGGGGRGGGCDQGREPLTTEVG